MRLVPFGKTMLVPSDNVASVLCEKHGEERWAVVVNFRQVAANNPPGFRLLCLDEADAKSCMQDFMQKLHVAVFGDRDRVQAELEAILTGHDAGYDPHA